MHLRMLGESAVLLTGSNHLHNSVRIPSSAELIDRLAPRQRFQLVEQAFVVAKHQLQIAAVQFEDDRVRVPAEVKTTRFGPSEN